MVLTRKEEDGLDGVLTIVGKDVEDAEIGLTFHDGIWHAHGDATQAKQSQARHDICEALYTTDGQGMAPKDIAIGIAKRGDTTRQLLKSLKEDGYIKVAHGHYTLTTKGAESVKHKRVIQDHADLDSLNISTTIPDHSNHSNHSNHSDHSDHRER